jgi:hypothetical protein
MLLTQETKLMSHPPVLAVAIAGVLAVATAAEAYRSTHLPRPGISQNTTTVVTPARQLDRALQALRIDANRESIAPAM